MDSKFEDKLLQSEQKYLGINSQSELVPGVPIGGKTNALLEAGTGSLFGDEKEKPEDNRGILKKALTGAANMQSTVRQFKQNQQNYGTGAAVAGTEWANKQPEEKPGDPNSLFAPGAGGSPPPAGGQPQGGQQQGGNADPAANNEMQWKNHLNRKWTQEATEVKAAYGNDFEKYFAIKYAEARQQGQGQ